MNPANTSLLAAVTGTPLPDPGVAVIDTGGTDMTTVLSGGGRCHGAELMRPG
jgi:hypothetical protein